MILARENSADEHRPCAIIIIIVPDIPHVENDNVPEIINPICPTEEYAISDFKSGCRRQIILVRNAPISDTDMIGVVRFLILGGNINISRYTPYPPSFSRIAAKIILPAIGASTCAFGSHRCVRNIGSLTKNPLINRIFIIFEIIKVFVNINRCGEFGVM